MNSKLFIKVAHVPAISREKWLEHRKTGIGGSDAGAIAGLSKYSSSFGVYCEKLGIVPEKQDTEAMRQGRDLEEYVAKRFCEAEGKKVSRFNYLVRSKTYPWAIADVDRVIVGENALLECKTTSQRNPTDFERGDIPPYWYCQVQHYLAVTGCDVCYLAVVVLGKAYYSFKIERNEADIQALMEIEKKFWEENILKKVEPQPDGSKTADEVIKGMYAISSDETPQVDLTIYAGELSEYRRLSAEVKDRKMRMEQIEQEIQLYMKDASRAQTDGVIISWKSGTRRTVDSTRLKAELPDVYDQYLKESVSRPFKINFSED